MIAAQPLTTALTSELPKTPRVCLVPAVSPSVCSTTTSSLEMLWSHTTSSDSVVGDARRVGCGPAQIHLDDAAGTSRQRVPCVVHGRCELNDGDLALQVPRTRAELVVVDEHHVPLTSRERVK